MKKIIVLFIFVFLLAACKKDEQIVYKTYPIHIKHSQFIASGTKLVITDSNTGELLDNLDFPLGVYDFTGSFQVREDVAVDLIDIHIISPAFDIFSFYVDTYAGVPVGSFVYLYLFESYTRGEKIYLNIADVEKFDTLMASNIYQQHVLFNPSDKSIYAELNTTKDNGCLLRVKANNNTNFKYYYLPDTLQGDTLNLKWSDFYEEINPRQIILPANVQSQSFSIDAVSPDFTKGISIVTKSGLTFTPTFDLPDFVPHDWLLRVRISMGARRCEQILDPTQPLMIHFPDISMDEFSNTDHQISISTTGDPDFIKIRGEGDFNWEINGSTETFKKLTLPDLSPFLEATMKQSSIEWKEFFIKKFDQHNAEEIRQGIPYQSSGFYPVARSGYHEIMYYR